MISQIRSLKLVNNINSDEKDLLVALVHKLQHHACDDRSENKYKVCVAQVIPQVSKRLENDNILTQNHP